MPRALPQPAPVVLALGLMATAALAAGLRSSPPLGRGVIGARDQPALDFARDVRPILADHCFVCHGPDPATRKAKLRLDLRESAFDERDGFPVLVPGDLEASELWQRINDPDDPMPPAKADDPLSADEIATLGRWIEAGAPWQEHWAFVAPVRPALPESAPGTEVAHAAWTRSAVDRFVLARLAAEGLEPSPEAPRETLIRRVTLDLTGLPPTLEEIDAFLADDAPDAYEKVVERLLASPHYGERMAQIWLDLARYGDTHALHLDNKRTMWRYRDWVIDAFNRNLSYDEFTIEQLAGDLLPDATVAQRVATGFNRCNPSSAEGGMIAEEFLVKYAIDRVQTTATTWMGLTLGCAQCHDHKYDPITQKEFYGFYAFFNSTADEASDMNVELPPPVVAAPLPGQAEGLAALDGELVAARAELDAPLPAADAAQAAWEREWRLRLAARWQPLDVVYLEASQGSPLSLQGNGSIRASGPPPPRETYEILARTELSGITAVRLEALTDPELPKGGISRGSHGNIVLTGFTVEVVPADQPNGFEPVPLTGAFADYAQTGFAVDRALDGDSATGWATDGLIADRVAVFTPDEPFGADTGAAPRATGNLLRIRLAQESGYTEHLLGRFRLSVSTDPALLPAIPSPWHVAGPFELALPEGTSIAAGTDPAWDRDWGITRFDPSARDPEGRALWRADSELGDGAVRTFETTAGSVFLGRTLHAASPRTYVLSLGSDDAVRVWHDGELVAANKVARSLAPDQDRIELDLHAGANSLVVEVVNFGGGHAFTARRLDEAVGGLLVGVAEDLGRANEKDPAGAQARERLTRVFRREHSPEWAALDRHVRELETARAELDARIPRTLVLAELPVPRPAHLLERGQYDHPGEPVERSVPSVLPPLRVAADEILAEAAPGAIGADGAAGARHRPDRLDLARWLVSANHPLTARVAVNRLWAQIFGTGLVDTPENFGTRGSLPTHPELLDWLAIEFVESGWDQKALLRALVTSATYRQSARATPELLERDPGNRLLARGPRFRLSAEAIRDLQLASSGLLVPRIGGPSVKPYQPDGLWRAVAYRGSNTERFERDDGEGLWRRSLYTYWKRTAAPPSMLNFDAPDRETCVASRARTNTPLQALNLLNDEQFVEAARVLAERVLSRESLADAHSGSVPVAARGATSTVPEHDPKHDPELDRARLALLFRLATARRPDAEEERLLLGLLASERAEFARRETAARELVEVGEAMTDPDPGASELAAWTVLASTVLNLDETITRG